MNNKGDQDSFERIIGVNHWSLELASKGKHFVFPRRQFIWFSSYFFRHSFPVYSTNSCFSCYCEQTLNSTPTAFWCALLTYLPFPFYYDISLRARTMFPDPLCIPHLRHYFSYGWHHRRFFDPIHILYNCVVKHFLFQSGASRVYAV